MKKEMSINLLGFFITLSILVGVFMVVIILGLTSNTKELIVGGDEDQVDSDSAQSEQGSSQPSQQGSQGGGSGSGSGGSQQGSEEPLPSQPIAPIPPPQLPTPTNPTQPTRVCGDAFIDSAETCDDGNILSSDGCSSACLIEGNYQCIGTPSLCYRSPSIFADNMLASDCVNNYDIRSRSCKTTPTGISAYKSIQAASDLLAPGTTLYIREGTYYEGLTIRKGGTRYAIVTIRPFKNEKAIINPGLPAKDYQWISNGQIHTLSLTKTPLSVGKMNDIISSNQYSIRVIEKDGFSLTRVENLNDLNNPLPIARDYNLFHYDHATKILSVRLLSTTPQDLFLIDGYRRIFVIAPYVEINALTIQYAYDGIKATWEGNQNDPSKNGRNLRIINNTIQHIADSGILGGPGSSDGIVIEGNIIRFVGEPLKYDQYLSMQNNNLDHAIYFSGENGVIRHNVLEKCYYYCLQAGHALDNMIPKNLKVSNNFVQNGIVIGGSDNEVYNNVFFGAVNIEQTTAMNVQHNLITLSDTKAVYLGKSGKLTDLKFKNNIILGAGDYCIETRNTDLASADINNNIYHNCAYFAIGDSTTRRYVNSFAAYQQLLQSQNAKLETDSLNTDPQIGYFTLKSTSPAIDAGICDSAITSDYKGDTRPKDGPDQDTQAVCDIGPYEF